MSPALAEGRGDVWLVYDGQCPVCSAYCKHARIADAVGRLHLVDAREPGALMDQITAAGLDIDQGMVLKFEDVMYYGPEAMRMLTLLGSPSGLFNRFNYLLLARRYGQAFSILWASRSVICC